MQKTFLKLTLIFIFSCQFAVANSRLKTGDIILLDMDCYTCQMIEDETQGPYSHSGLVIEVGQELKVTQSLGDVHHLSVAEFMKYTTKKALVIRPKLINDRKRDYIKKRYLGHYRGMLFDHDYVWDDEKLYCSEYIYKLLDEAGVIRYLNLSPMSFDRNYDFWYRYYNGNIPTGKEGMSPNDFWRSKDFYHVFYLN